LPRRLCRGGLDRGLRAARPSASRSDPPGWCSAGITPNEGPEYLVVPKRVAAHAFGFELVRDVQPGEAIFIDESGTFHSRQCAAKPVRAPCIFEYVYLARPTRFIDGVSCTRAGCTWAGIFGEDQAHRLPAWESMS